MLYTSQGGTWSQDGLKLAELFEAVAAGYSVALSADGNTALVGSPGYDEEDGAAWVFTRTGSAWTQQGGALSPNDENNQPLGGQFGSSVALSSDGNTALIGGPSDNQVGAAWVFTRSGGAWTQQGSKLAGAGENTSSGVRVFVRDKRRPVRRREHGASIGGSGRRRQQAPARLWVFTRSCGRRLDAAGPETDRDRRGWPGGIRVRSRAGLRREHRARSLAARATNLLRL